MWHSGLFVNRHPIRHQKSFDKFESCNNVQNVTVDNNKAYSHCSANAKCNVVIAFQYQWVWCSVVWLTEKVQTLFEGMRDGYSMRLEIFLKKGQLATGRASSNNQNFEARIIICQTIHFSFIVLKILLYVFLFLRLFVQRGVATLTIKWVGFFCDHMPEFFSLFR